MDIVVLTIAFSSMNERMNELMYEWLNIYLTDLAKKHAHRFGRSRLVENSVSFDISQIQTGIEHSIEILLLYVLFNCLFLTLCIAKIHPFSPIFKLTE